ncbi:NADH-quinone oxidoreductase subunit NuoG [Thiohalorhabdus sp.]|uniref:NADH-quinone oxidoreductase subunit NuoG n=1 Tax=Thiohalorhabdus sp. TaxID=3094134 RepID=UPI002FC37257
MAEIYINGESYNVDDGQMIIEVTDQLGIDVPRFCYHRKLSVAANCRMCLVEVEKMRKPVPACATPVSDGMHVHTHSDTAVDGRRGIMEFLLINHPLDCPICDQGGECDLQDLAMAHGSSHSRYLEDKRSVEDANIGPLIETEMTRCIHCTRCVRFGEEVGGMMELGATFRGEEMEIGTYVGRTVESELSGNMIDLCPVGALTSKPYRYKARVWEMRRHDSVCPHCSVGCNLEIEEVQGEVKRTLPVTNEAINEEWLCDKGRYSYEAVHHNRVERPHIFRGGQWQAVSWEAAFDVALNGLRSVGKDLAGVVAPTATLEEQWLTQHLVRGLGGTDVDHRLGLADSDFDAHIEDATPLLGQPLAELEDLDAAIVIGGNPRKDQPLANHRLRKAVRKGAQVSALNPAAYPKNFRYYHDLIHGPGQDAPAVAALAAEVAGAAGSEVPANVAGVDAASAGLTAAVVQAVAQALARGERVAVLVGTQAQEHPQAAELIGLAHQVAALAGARFGYLAAYGNSVGGWAMGAVPHRGPGGDRVARGQPASAFLGEGGRAGYVVVGADPLVEGADPVAARHAFEKAACRVVVTTHWSQTAEEADVVLPMAAYPENEGSLLSGEGRLQGIHPAAEPVGEARPAWKILRVLGHSLGVPGSEFVEVAEIRQQAETAIARAGLTSGGAPADPRVTPEPASSAGEGLVRLPARHIYHDDLFVRNAPSLQEQFGGMVATMHPDTAADLGLREFTEVRFEGVHGGAEWLPVHLDSAVPEGAVWIPQGEDSADLGPAFGRLRVGDVAAARPVEPAAVQSAKG